jgi:hypothetical protein
MNQFGSFDQCYSGCDATGRLILTGEFRRSIDAHYARQRARATDAAPDDEEPDEQARIAAMQAFYDRARGKAERIPDRDAFLHPQLNNLPLEAERTRKAGETMSGIAPEEHQKRLDYFKKTHPNLTTDQADDEVESLMELENYYASRRALLALIFFIAFLFAAPSMHAQVQPVPIYGGAPTIGTTCANAPANSGTPTAFLTAAGGIISCQGGLWQTWPFAVFRGAGSAVTMNGSDTPIFSIVLPPLPSAGCFDLSYGIGSGLSSATIKLAIDGTTISTPFSPGSVTGVDISVTALRYCNTGSQTAQTLVYELGAAGWLTFVTPNAGWDFSGGAGVGSSSDSPVSVPPSINWASPHVLTVSVSQASGSVTPEYLRISGGF